MKKGVQRRKNKGIKKGLHKEKQPDVKKRGLGEAK